jgi:hypothetical protein
MKTISKPLLSIFIITFFNSVGYGQHAEMADAMRAEGKIYVVVSMIIILLGGMITYLFLLDRKLSKVEKEVNEKLKLNGKR